MFENESNNEMQSRYYNCSPTEHHDLPNSNQTEGLIEFAPQIINLSFI